MVLFRRASSREGDVNCKCLSMHSFSSEEDLREKRHIALHVLGQFEKKNCTEQK